MRAAILTALMNLAPVAPVDIFRFLRVPAIVLTIRRAGVVSGPQTWGVCEGRWSGRKPAIRTRCRNIVEERRRRRRADDAAKN